MKRISYIIIAAVLTLFAGCSKTDFTKVENVVIFYRTFDYTKYDEDADAYSLKKEYAVELNAADCEEMARIFSNLQPSDPSNCGFEWIEIVVHEGDRKYSFFPANDGDNNIKISDDRYRMFDEDGLSIAHEIIARNAPDELSDIAAIFERRASN